MKKWLLILFVLAALLVLTPYILIPHEMTISVVELMRANSQASSRYLTNESNWKKMFVKKAAKKSSEFKQPLFTPNRTLADGVEVMITKNGISDSSLIHVIRLNSDSSVIRWTVIIETSSNPLKRSEQYFTAERIRHRMEVALGKMKRFLENEENLYGITVNRTTVKDTLLIATKETFKNYPSVQDIYKLINLLQNYAKMNDATQSGYPMLDIKTTDSENFQTMVALPVNKELNDHGPILHKEMVPGNILVSEVQGGPYTVTNAFNSLQAYVTDHDLQSPAIPFQSLITDRSQQPDSTKWVTKIYYPIY